MLSVVFTSTVLSLCAPSSSIEPSVKCEHLFLGMHLDYFTLTDVLSRSTFVPFASVVLRYMSTVTHILECAVQRSMRIHCSTAICGTCLHRSRKLHKSMNFLDDNYSSLMAPLSSLLISLMCFIMCQLVVHCFVHYFHNGCLWW